jgi:hypothetical protein
MLVWPPAFSSMNNRAAIEEQYAARLNALSKFPLGGDEIGYASVESHTR